MTISLALYVAVGIFIGVLAYFHVKNEHKEQSR